ncbi:hypothetical protein BH10ACT1_BH10ACT1_14930 [soil metagenome]
MRTSQQSSRPAPALQLLVVLALALAAVGCGVASADPNPGGGGGTGAEYEPATTEVHVAFQDSSVPPQYHRSYEIIVADRQAHVVVDSYGTVIRDEEIAIPDSVWTAFVRSLDNELAAIDEADEPNEDCPGGTSIAVEVSSGDARFARDMASCGSDHNEAITDQLGEVLAPIYRAVDLEALTATD